MAGFVEPAFKSVKPNQVDFQIWRVENFKVTPVPREHYGQFFEGDAYIVYSAAGPRQTSYADVKPYASNGILEIHIHFWLGSKCSIDEAGTAAMKSVELDDYLGGSPIQHREVQGFESAKFKSYFKSGIRILTGGIASGLRHVVDESKVRLFKIKGKRCPTLTEQPSVSWEHFNHGDVFILQTRETVFVWVGQESNRMERLQGSKVAMQLRDERGGEANIVFVDDGQEDNLPQDERQQFNEHLPDQSKHKVKPAEADVQDAKMEITGRGALKLYKVSDEDGTCKVVQIKEGSLNQSDLDSNDSFIIDNKASGVWVWVGKKATIQEKKQALLNAQAFVKKKEYSNSVAVTRVIDGAEPTEFKMLFLSWKDPAATTNILKKQHSVSKIAPTITTKFNAKTLHETPGLAADTQLVDDGTGKTVVWRLHNKDLELVPDSQFGLFFSGDCYLIHYMYEFNNRQRHLLYYWLGTHSSQDERGTIAWHAVQKDDALNGAAVQVRAVQSKEPPHLLTIFKGKMIIFNGGYASSFDGKGASNVGVTQQFLVQVRGGENHTARAVQVDFKASSLNTNDVFVLRTPKACYIWCGKGSTGDERERAKVIAEEWAINKDYTVMIEGQEKEEFWKLLGGREAYANDTRLADPTLSRPARLFHCSDASGRFKAEEIIDFSQSDLVPEDVMVLDAYRAIYVWVGEGANKTEKSQSLKLVSEYLESDPSQRDPDTPIIILQQGYEPPTFTGFFGIWDPDIWKDSDYESVRRRLEQDNKKKPTNDVVVMKAADVQKSVGTFAIYPLAQLRDMTADNAPDNVDLLRKEKYLSDEDFIQAFGMKKSHFEVLPAWKQTNLKKAAKLF